MGPISYQRLPQIASQKVHVSSTINEIKRQFYSYQPVQGKTLYGGIKIGLMESMALEAHGSTNVLTSLKSIDEIELMICLQCKSSYSIRRLENTYICWCCNSYDSIETIRGFYGKEISKLYCQVLYWLSWLLDPEINKHYNNCGITKQTVIQDDNFTALNLSQVSVGEITDINDKRLGVEDDKNICITCGRKYPECIGHLGYIWILNRHIPVLPYSCRPSYADKVHHITALYQDLLILKQKESELSTKFESSCIKKLIELYEEIKSVVLKPKGYISQYVTSKRVSNASRTVVTPGPFLQFGEIGIPLSLSKQLTIPRIVMLENIEYYKNEIKLGKNSKKVKSVLCGNKIRDLGIYRNTTKLEQSLSVGDTINCYLQEGDTVLVNRYPTMNRGGMIGCKVVILNDHNSQMNTIRLPLNMCKSFNADFDGDEMQIICVQIEDFQFSDPCHASNNLELKKDIQDSKLYEYLFNKKLDYTDLFNCYQDLDTYGVTFGLNDVVFKETVLKDEKATSNLHILVASKAKGSALNIYDLCKYFLYGFDSDQFITHCIESRKSSIDSAFLIQDTGYMYKKVVMACMVKLIKCKLTGKYA